MPLNTNQRDEIEKSIAHLFYGLSADDTEFTKEIAALSKAIEKALPKLLEEKEPEEKHIDANPFTDLSKIITDSESLIKGLENRHTQRITVNEVTEYIIFYAICRVQHHLQHLKDDDDDFKLITWLENNGAGEDDLKTVDDNKAPVAWELPHLLTKTRANHTLKSRGWNTEKTLQCLALQKDRPFTTFIPNVDYGSYNFNWQLPELRDRMYRAEIKERWIESRNSNNYPLPPIPNIDLYITTPFSKEPEIIKYFHAYPRSMPLRTATVEAINKLIDSQDFETPAAKEKARSTAIRRAEDAETLELEEKIKAIAMTRAEKEATRLIVRHIEKITSMATHSPAQLREDNPIENALDAADIDGHDHIPENPIDSMPTPLQALVLSAMPIAIPTTITHTPLTASTMTNARGNESFNAFDIDGNDSILAAEHKAVVAGISAVDDLQQYLYAVDQEIDEVIEFHADADDLPPTAPVLQYTRPDAVAIDIPRTPSPANLELPPLGFDENLDLSAFEQNPHSAARDASRSPQPLSPFDAQFSPIASPENKAEEHSHNSISSFDLAANAEEDSSSSHYNDEQGDSASKIEEPESELEESEAEEDDEAEQDAERQVDSPNQSSNVAMNDADSINSSEMKLSTPPRRSRAPTPHRVNRTPTPPMPGIEMSLSPSFADEIDNVLNEIDALIGDDLSSPNGSHAPASPSVALLPSLPIRSQTRAAVTAANLPSAQPGLSLFSRPLLSPRRTHPRSTHFLTPPTAKKPRPAPIKQDKVNIYAAGMSLVTHKYYYEEVSAERMSLFGLEIFSYQETRNLSSLAVISFLKNGLMETSTALALKEGFLKLIETPHYFKYFQLHPESIALALNITLDFAKAIGTPFITHLLDRGEITLEADVLKLTSNELSIINHPMYGEYFCHNPKALALIKGVTPEECRVLLNRTVSGLVDKRILTIDTARALAKNLQAFQLDVLFDETCLELFFKGKLNALDKITPQHALNLRDPKISVLIEMDVLTADAGMNLTAEEKVAYAIPPVHALLLAKKATPEQVKKFSPTITMLTTSEPYASALANDPDFLLIFLQWKDEEVLQLFTPAIRSLFQHGIINLESFRNPALNFFFVLNGAHTSQLLIEKKISLAQALDLTPTSWNVIETHALSYNLIRGNTDNQQQLGYLPFTIWSTLLTSRIIALYRGMPELQGSVVDTIDIINEQIDAIAAGEQISKLALQQHCAGFFLTMLNLEINADLQNIPTDRIPLVYQNIRNAINSALSNSNPDWLTTLNTVAQDARTGLRENSLRRFVPTTVNMNDRPVLHQNFLTQPVKITNAGCKYFCEQVLEIARLHQPLQPRLRYGHFHAE